MQRANRTIEQQINRLLWMLPVTDLIILGLILMLFSINGQYASVLQRANTAADFNAEFKEMLDLEMYNHVIRPRSDTSAEELPRGVRADAGEVLRRLETITTLPDNQWRVQSMLAMCENLRSYMIDIALTPSYDERMALLERNIRGETGLTKLIETYMHNYVGAEVRELAQLQSRLNDQMKAIGVMVVVGAALLTAILILYSVRVTRRIVKPINQLSRKAKQFGGGDFGITPIHTHISELQTLDSGFNDMAGHINALMLKQVEDQQSLRRAELELLQSQINTHFLYNTLDSIAILADCHREEDVITMVTSLSTFFRNSLNKGEDIISLAAECSQVKSYLEIQSIRYSDILSYEIHIPQELMDCQVPKLILQPLVENALYHGIKNRRGLGKIIVSGWAQDSDMILQVSDNGVGMTDEQLKTLREGIAGDHLIGHGLVNVHKRIRLHCGAPYGLLFESETGKGSTVTAMLTQRRTVERKDELS